MTFVSGIIGSRFITLAIASVPGFVCSRPRMMYGPIEIWSRFVWSSTRCFSAPRGPVATTANRSSRTTDTLSMATLWPSSRLSNST